MADRLWRGESREISPGVRRHGYPITCSQCQTDEFVTFGTHSGLMSPEGVEKKFRSRKWRIGRKDGEDLCPTCAGAHKAEKKQKPTTQETTMPKTVKTFDDVAASVTPGVFTTPSDSTATTVAQAPKRATLTLAPKPELKPMSREDRRVIFAKLDEVYLDEERGYRTGWHDQKVATDLGVPVEWVKGIRDENFGPAGNDEWRKILEEAKGIPARHAEITQEVTHLSEEFRHLAEKGRELSAKVTKLGLDVERIHRALESIEKAVA